MTSSRVKLGLELGIDNLPPKIKGVLKSLILLGRSGNALLRNRRISGARAAAVGGYSAVVAMPNTEPAIDNAMVAQFVLDRGREAAVDVAVAGAISKRSASSASGSP